MPPLRKLSLFLDKTEVILRLSLFGFRWSILTYEGMMPPPRKLSQQMDPISVYEDSVAAHLSKILNSGDHSIVISSAK